VSAARGTRFLALGVALFCGCGRFAFDIAYEPLDCPTEYEQVGTGCYRHEFNTVELAWTDAEAACEADGAGAHLAVIDDAGEMARLIRILAVQDASIGLNDRGVEGTYRTVTVVEAYVRWAPGQPGGVDDCAALRAEGMHDRDCVDLNDYLCEYDGIPAVPGTF
jgi:hypothetical protein